MNELDGNTENIEGYPPDFGIMLCSSDFVVAILDFAVFTTERGSVFLWIEVCDN
jgi:hypothetical protein